MMQNWKVRSVVLVLAVALVLPSTGLQVLAAQGGRDTGLKDEPSTPGMLFDLVFVRPFGIAATVLGTGFFFVSLPFSALGGNSDLAFKRLVVAPAKFTFNRPLGEGSRPDPP